jgi:hypothetical protein
MRYAQRIDDVEFGVPVGVVYKLCCCDCGLVHNCVFRIEGDKLYLTATRNKRSTGQKRRYMMIEIEE